MEREWAKVPQNKSDANVNIVGVLLALRKEDEMGIFTLDQTCILSILANILGSSRPVNFIHFNERILIYRIIMAMALHVTCHI